MKKDIIWYRNLLYYYSNTWGYDPKGKFGIRSVKIRSSLLVMFLIITFVNFLQVIVGVRIIPSNPNAITIIIVVIIYLGSITFDYFSIFKNNRYLIYFKEFEEMTSEQKKYYKKAIYWFVALSLVFFLGSFALVFNM